MTVERITEICKINKETGEYRATTFRVSTDVWMKARCTWGYFTPQFAGNRFIHLFFGIPVFEDSGMLKNSWRLENSDGNIIEEGMIDGN